MTLRELKEGNSEAYTALIVFWAELSCTSILSSKFDIRENLGGRYFLKNNNGSFEFTDTHAGQVFLYDEIKNDWSLK